MENTSEFVRQMLAVAREEQLYSEGRLMSPTQVKEGLSANTPQHQILEGWFLCGELHPELFAQVKAGLQAQTYLEVKPGALGVQYFLLAQKFGIWQHRFLMPLVGASAQRFLADMHVSGIGASFSLRDGEDAVVSRIFPLDDWKRLARLRIPEKVSADRAIELVDEITRVALHLHMPAALKRHSEGVERACVTVVFTDEFAQQLRIALGQNYH